LPLLHIAHPADKSPGHGASGQNLIAPCPRPASCGPAPELLALEVRGGAARAARDEICNLLAAPLRMAELRRD